MVVTAHGSGCVFLLLVLVLSGCTASGSQRHSAHVEARPVSVSAHHDPHIPHLSTPTASQPTLAGQYAFATVGEVVALLEADPTTDWSSVNLERLRQHLIDMHRVTIDASVDVQHRDGGARFVVRGSDSRTQASVQRMVSAHAQTLASAMTDTRTADDGPAGWQTVAEPINGGVSLTVTAADEEGADQIRGLGFIGIMVLGSHHPIHHLAMATGKPLHHHTR